MSQAWAVGEIIPGSTAPATDIIKLTDALDALKSNFGGASLPTTSLVAGMLVVLDSGKKYIRNPTNDDWIDQDEVYARHDGSATKVFNVEAATADDHAVSRVFGDARYAALNGNASQAFEGSTLKATTGMAVGGATPGAGGIAFPPIAVAVADPNTQDDYKEYTSASAACTGAITTAAIWKATKVGNTVTLTLPNVQGIATAVSNFAFGEALPSSFRPAAALSIVCVCIVNDGAGTAVPGMVDISAAGIISIYRDATFVAAFTNGANAGIRYAVSVSWTI